jgi:hypothetical protein
MIWCFPLTQRPRDAGGKALAKEAFTLSTHLMPMSGSWLSSGDHTRTHPSRRLAGGQLWNRPAKSGTSSSGI